MGKPMTLFPKTIALFVFGALIVGGCATSGGTSSSDVAAATHRTAQRLNTNVNESLKSLNASTADLSARLEQYDQQVRRLRLLVEDNQTRLDAVQQRLDELSTTLYKQLNLTPPVSAAPPAQQGGAEVQEEDIRIIPPAQVLR
jgi:ABC-type transporter Mla subunit MlaD